MNKKQKLKCTRKVYGVWMEPNITYPGDLYFK